MAIRLTNNDRALYFYGVSRRGVRLPKALRGIDALVAVESCDCSGLTCWFSRVDRSEYGERLEQNMENLEWLANASVHHQRVVGSIAEIVDVLPARFGTVFLSESSMAADVARRKLQLARALKRIEGAAEWGVKVFAEARPATAPAPATSGIDYLRKKSELLHQRSPAAAPRELGKMRAELETAAVASAAARGKAPQPGLVWQASFLVKRKREKAFQEVLRRYAPQLEEARIETSGPWPPYSFASTPEEDQPDPGTRKAVVPARNAGGTPGRRKNRKKPRATRSRPHR